jgi:putative transposase
VRIRWVVERTHAWLGRCRRLTKDHEYLISSSESWVQISAIQQMIRCLKPNTERPQPEFKYPKRNQKVA